MNEYDANFFPDIITLIKRDGNIITNIQAQMENEHKALIPNGELQIEDKDIIIQKMLSGAMQIYIINHVHRIEWSSGPLYRIGITKCDRDSHLNTLHWIGMYTLYLTLMQVCDNLTHQNGHTDIEVKINNNEICKSGTKMLKIYGIIDNYEFIDDHIKIRLNSERLGRTVQEILYDNNTGMRLIASRLWGLVDGVPINKRNDTVLDINESELDNCGIPVSDYLEMLARDNKIYMYGTTIGGEMTLGVKANLYSWLNTYKQEGNGMKDGINIINNGGNQIIGNNNTIGLQQQYEDVIQKLREIGGEKSDEAIAAVKEVREHKDRDKFFAFVYTVAVPAISEILKSFAKSQGWIT